MFNNLDFKIILLLYFAIYLSGFIRNIFIYPIVNIK